MRNPWDRVISIKSFGATRPSTPGYDVCKNGTLTEFLAFWESTGFQQQYDMLSDPETGEIIVNKIGRFETLAEDFREICRQLGIACDLPHKNASRHKDYRSYFSDAEREAVARLYAKDIEKFGYSFDGAFETDQANPANEMA